MLRRASRRGMLPRMTQNTPIHQDLQDELDRLHLAHARSRQRDQLIFWVCVLNTAATFLVVLTKVL